MAQIIRKTFSLTPKDLEIIDRVVKECGFVSDSEALRHIIRFYAEHAPCLKERQQAGP